MIPNVTTFQVSNEKNPAWLFDIGDEKLPNYMGIVINHYIIRIPIKQPV